MIENIIPRKTPFHPVGQNFGVKTAIVLADPEFAITTRLKIIIIRTSSPPVIMLYFREGLIPRYAVVKTKTIKIRDRGIKIHEGRAMPVSN
jgi:hypothetical protein